MCLYTTQKIPTITEKDITCYKVICKNMSSLYHNHFKWKFGKTYHSWIEVVDYNRVVDHNNKDCNFKEIHQAFHSYETLEDLKIAYFNATSPCLVVKCTIPKGSTVYRGKHDYLKGYASNQLIINEVVSIKELYPDFNWDNYPYKEGQMIQVKIPHYKFWYEQVKSHGENWKDYQITNIQLHGGKDLRVDLILEDCETLDSTCITTTFNGVAWVTNQDVRLKENKEE